MPRDWRKQRPESQGGAVAVEFALIFCFVLIPLVMGLLEYGWYFYASETTGSATRETARRLSVGDCQTGTQARDYARSQSGFKFMNVQFGSASTYNGTVPDVGQEMRVEGSTVAKLTGLLPLPDGGTIVRTVRVRVEDRTEDTTC